MACPEPKDPPTTTSRGSRPHPGWTEIPGPPDTSADQLPTPDYRGGSHLATRGEGRKGCESDGEGRGLPSDDPPRVPVSSREHEAERGRGVWTESSPGTWEARKTVVWVNTGYYDTRRHDSEVVLLHPFCNFTHSSKDP